MLAGVSVANKIGSVRVDTLKLGEYVLGRKDFTAGLNELITPEKASFIYPNTGIFNVKLPEWEWNLELFDLTGKRLANWNTTDGEEIRTEGLVCGQYILSATNGNLRLTQSLIIQ
jgi:hypothetical protein